MWLWRVPGSLICIGSVHAVNPMADWAVYSTMKSGLECMVRVLACDLRAHNIRVNVVAPGGMANGLPQDPADIDGPTDPGWYKKVRTPSARGLGAECAQRSAKEGCN